MIAQIDPVMSRPMYVFSKSIVAIKNKVRKSIIIIQINLDLKLLTLTYT